MTNIIIINKDLYRYEIHSLFKAFYPSEEIKVVVEGDAHAKGILQKNPFLMAEIIFARDQIDLVLYAPGTVPLGTGSLDRKNKGSDGQREMETGGRHFQQLCTPGCTDSLDQKNKTAKDTLKKFLYRSLSVFTGRTLPWGDLIGIRPTKICTTLLEEGRTPEEAVRFMEEEHQVSHEKAVLAEEIAARELSILAPIHYENGFSLYIGIPFCPTTCLYCSFPSFNVALWKDKVDDYLTALIREMQACASLLQGKILDTVYVGGGTPTTLEPAQLDRLLAAVENCFDTSHLLEFTVEAGRPDSMTKEKLETLRAHKVTRISVNPQTMNEETLRIIGRQHTVAQTREAYELARACGFDNINMDIILGLPGEDVAEVNNTMQEIEKLCPDDLTVHSLAIKRASRLRRIIDERGYPTLVNTEETMKIAAAGAAAMGMQPYYLYRQKNMSGNFENTGYAKPGKYGIYNILIMEEKQSILALGAGSISKIVVHDAKNPEKTRIERADHPKDVATYMENIEEMIRREEQLFAVG